MTTTINKSTLVENIWKNFYDTISDNVKFVTITGNKKITVQSIVAAYPDKKLDSKANYPIIIVHFPDLSTEPFTLTKTNVTGSIDIEVLTNQAESADKFSSAIMDIIETNKFTFSSINLQNVEVESTDSQMHERGTIKVHDRIIRLGFDFKYDKTRAY